MGEMAGEQRSASPNCGWPVVFPAVRNEVAARREG
jgi:hypothetical protein